MKNEIKLGIIGTNFISDTLCESAEKVDGIKPHAVYSRTHEKGAGFAAKHGVEKVYCDLDEFLSSDIDAVYIASPNFLHGSQSLAAISHGKHVIVEKPAALNEKEFSLMAGAAKEKGVVLMEAMRPVHDPAMKEAKTALGEIGRIRRASIEYCQYSSRYDKFRAGTVLNAFDVSLGNAAIMDIGVYAVEVLVYLLGMPEKITASKSIKLMNGFEGMGNVMLDYGGFTATVAYSKISDSAVPSFVQGEDGYVTVVRPSSVDEVTVHTRKGGTRIIAKGRPECNMIYELSDFVKAVGGGLDLSYYTELTRGTLHIMDEIRRENGVAFPTEI